MTIITGTAGGTGMLQPSGAAAAGYGASFIVSGIAALLCLEARCRDEQHKLFGRSSRWWAIAIILSTATVATVLGNVTALAPPLYWGIGASVALVGALLAGEVKRSVQAKQVTNAPPTHLVMIASVGIALLVHRFENSFRGDRLAWADQWFNDPKWLGKVQEPDEIEAAASHFFAMIIRQAGEDESPSRRRADLIRLEEAIHNRIHVASLCYQDPPASRDQVIEELRQHGLLNEGNYHGLASQGELSRLGRKLCSDAMQDLQDMILYAYRRRYSLEQFSWSPASSSGRSAETPSPSSARSRWAPGEEAGPGSDVETAST
ncbi:hypothetical protein [Actinomadura sp. B10D3]|uniref:hypothetical protein n=1 Tax=Actinomadura sp. B10D3 TaxID=3153557 RepID=UPI00325DF5B6